MCVTALATPKQPFLNALNAAKGTYAVLANITPEEFKELYNPLKLLGMFYICSACEPSTIPSDDEGNYKPRGRTKNTNPLQRMGY